MRNFDRNNNSGGRRDFGGDRNRERPQMHEAICSSCGKTCQLPFRPSGDRPVYCSDCFAKTNGAEPRRNFDRNDRRDDRGGSRPPFRKFDNDTSGKSLRKLQFEALEAKLDKIIALLSDNNTIDAKPSVAPAPKKKSEPKSKPAVETVQEVAVTEPEVVIEEPEVITEVVEKKKRVVKK